MVSAKASEDRDFGVSASFFFQYALSRGQKSPIVNRQYPTIRHVYPSTFRERMSNLWKIPDLRNWWLPNDEGYPAVVRNIRSSMENRLPTNIYRSRSEDQRNIKSIFAHLSLDDPPDKRPSIGQSLPHSSYGPPANPSWTSAPPVPPRMDDEEDDDSLAEDFLLDESRQRFSELMQDDEEEMESMDVDVDVDVGE